MPEVILWGEASWWPKNSLMRFVRKDGKDVQKGTRYRQEVLLPFAPSWDVEVSALTGESITRLFLNGMFAGSEVVSLREQGEDIIVFYSMTYEVKGLLNKILWFIVFCRLHDRNIETILANLKEFLEKRRT